MEKFSTLVTTVKAYTIDEDTLIDLANNIEGVINEYIRINWDCYDADDIPLEVRQQLLQHIVNEMLHGDFTWLGEEGY